MAMAVWSARSARVSPSSRRWVGFECRIGDLDFPWMRRLPGWCWPPRQRPHVIARWGLGAGGPSLTRCGPGLVAAPPGGGLDTGRRGGRLGLRAVALAVAGGAGAVAGLARASAGAGGRGRGRRGGLAVAVALAGAAGGDHEPARGLAGLVDLAILDQALKAVADRAAGAAQRLGDL